jgi:hypothetical protein
LVGGEVRAGDLTADEAETAEVELALTSNCGGQECPTHITHFFAEGGVRPFKRRYMAAAP